jgi:hypothetical protein
MPKALVHAKKIFSQQIIIFFYLGDFAIYLIFTYCKDCLVFTVERCKHVKSRATTVYFRLGRLRRVSTYVQQMWGIIGHVTVEAGNTVGTDGAPPQVSPKLCGGRLRG